MTVNSTLEKETAGFKQRDEFVKPYALMDLDDTLFQTKRKIKAWDLPTSTDDELAWASVNKQNEPLSYMTTRQQNLVNWLLNTTDLIVVTARDRQEIKRVNLPFSSWQVLTHGAVILQPDGAILPDWQKKMMDVLSPLQDTMNQLSDIIADYNLKNGQQLKLSVHTDNFRSDIDVDVNVDKQFNENGDSHAIYLAIKHKQKDSQALQDFANWLWDQYPSLVTEFYCHINANNCAILPHAVHKRHAVAFLLTHFLDGTRPSFGFGDSLADLPYLQLLDWYGTPNHGQLHDKISEIIL